MSLIDMYIAFLKIGLFSFGGGYASLPLIESLIVKEKGWLTMAEYADLLTIAEMTPGPIAVNAATFTGQRLAGTVGALVCTFGCITPSLVIVLLLSYFYMKYKNLRVIQSVLKRLRPVVAAMIAAAACGLFTLAVFGTNSLQIELSEFSLIHLILFGVGLLLLRRAKWSPIAVLAGSGLVGIVIGLLQI